MPRKQRVKIVIDTNVFVGNFLARNPRSANRRVVRSWFITRRFKLVLSDEIETEYLRIFREVLDFDSASISGHLGEIFLRVLIGSVGYKNLRDLSFGPLLLSCLSELGWPDTVELEDLSYGPIAVMQNWQDAPGRYQRAIFLSAVPRGRQPGTLELYQWQPPELTTDLVQERINEGVTGVISLDNLLVICQHFGVLPPEVICVEVEPVNSEFGSECSEAIVARLAAATDLVRHEALSEQTHAARGGVCLRD